MLSNKIDKTYSWVNGKEVSYNSVFDRGLAFGDGAFETVGIEDAKLKFLKYHILRLEKGCKLLSISFNSHTLVEEVQKIRLEVLNYPEISRWRLKIIITRGESNTGYVADEKISPNRIILLTPISMDIDFIRQQGVKVRMCDWPLSIQPRLAGLKHLNRLDQVMARKEWQDPSIFEGLMRDCDGNIIEGTCTNLFLIDHNDNLLTPLVDRSGVDGVMRQAVIRKLCPELGLSIEEVSIKSFKKIKELFITNAIIGIVPVIAVESLKFPIGSQTIRLQKALNNYIH